MENNQDLREIQNEVHFLKPKHYKFYAEGISMQSQYRDNIVGVEYFDLLDKRKIKILELEVVPTEDIGFGLYRTYRLNNCSSLQSFEYIKSSYMGDWRIACLFDSKNVFFKSIEEVMYYLEL